MISVHFYKSSNLLGRLVNLFGQTEYVHVALQIDSRHIIETDFRKQVAMNHIKQKSSMILYFDMDERIADEEVGYIIENLIKE